MYLRFPFGKNKFPRRAVACRRLSAGLLTIIGKLADNCGQTCRQLSAGNFLVQEFEFSDVEAEQIFISFCSYIAST